MDRAGSVKRAVSIELFFNQGKLCKENSLICSLCLQPCRNHSHARNCQRVAHYEGASRFLISSSCRTGEILSIWLMKKVSTQENGTSLNQGKIEYIGKVDKGEIFAPALPIKNNCKNWKWEELYSGIKTGSGDYRFYPTIPVTCRILHIPLVWAIQSTGWKNFSREEPEWQII